MEHEQTADQVVSTEPDDKLAAGVSGLVNQFQQPGQARGMEFKHGAHQFAGAFSPRGIGASLQRLDQRLDALHSTSELAIARAHRRLPTVCAQVRMVAFI